MFVLAFAGGFCTLRANLGALGLLRFGRSRAKATMTSLSGFSENAAFYYDRLVATPRFLEDLL